MYGRILVMLGLLVTGCSSTRITEPSYARKARTIESASVIRENIVTYASGLVGAPYKYGGRAPGSGFDCSGLTSYALSRYGITLPRTSGSQARLGRAISARDAQPGDLVFFGKGTKVSHVGLVIRNDRNGIVMVHSSSSRGVIVENVDRSQYWRRHLLFAVDIESL